ncbi:MAG: metalloregulator ArsR/SmtB family transcription factor [Gemmatimonadota bacterium]
MDIEPALDYLKLLANETRLKLLGLLADRERSVGELAEILSLKEPTISHHLSKLSGAELVRMRADGTVHLYRLNVDTLNLLGRELFTPERVVSLGGHAGAGAWESSVLETYLREGRLSKIPGTRRKRDVVLRWLAERFEAGRRYPEREVNEIIGGIHPDFATLRRELIGAKLMERADGEYWRVPFGEEAGRANG